MTLAIFYSMGKQYKYTRTVYMKTKCMGFHFNLWASNLSLCKKNNNKKVPITIKRTNLNGVNGIGSFAWFFIQHDTFYTFRLEVFRLAEKTLIMFGGALMVFVFWFFFGWILGLYQCEIDSFNTTINIWSVWWERERELRAHANTQ